MWGFDLSFEEFALRAGSDAKQLTNRSCRLGGVVGEQEGVKTESCQPLPNLQLLPAFPAPVEIPGFLIKIGTGGNRDAFALPDARLCHPAALPDVAC